MNNLYRYSHCHLYRIEPCTIRLFISTTKSYGTKYSTTTASFASSSAPHDDHLNHSDDTNMSLKDINAMFKKKSDNLFLESSHSFTSRNILNQQEEQEEEKEEEQEENQYISQVNLDDENELNRLFKRENDNIVEDDSSIQDFDLDQDDDLNSVFRKATTNKHASNTKPKNKKTRNIFQEEEDDDDDDDGEQQQQQQRQQRQQQQIDKEFNRKRMQIQSQQIKAIDKNKEMLRMTSRQLHHYPHVKPIPLTFSKDEIKSILESPSNNIQPQITTSTLVEQEKPTIVSSSSDDPISLDLNNYDVEKEEEKHVELSREMERLASMKIEDLYKELFKNKRTGQIDIDEDDIKEMERFSRVSNSSNILDLINHNFTDEDIDRLLNNNENNNNSHNDNDIGCKNKRKNK
ncbi:hypothetical protein DFA_07601 [Cavenderia fasciculata]|uniref:Uncharacterized protein n=1 Tax=Cavenderia fasciculata TaxID=261658 RepID=F4Q637_CACFS|nr:uncharacterized protein DFA_07601 [Cavenderia fasciculata]EGG16623.1 hypothetical protein DFA_07601 [Cavenderia fasciculata]|eukprot:XP_004355097.1 hypothetical protein DFA_07601 [Cavenderia fasciculata]